MFKKIEAWVLYLTIILGIIFSVGFGILVRQELVGNTKFGWISKTALTLSEIPVTLKKFMLGPLNGLRVEDRFPSLDGFIGNPNSEVSYLLLSKYNGDLENSIVELVDLTNFEVLHTWNPNIDAMNDLVKLKDEFKYLKRDKGDKRSLLIHPKLTKDGGLLFTNTAPLKKIDSCSRLIFQNTHDQFHHSIEIDIDGNIWVPSHLYPQTLPITKIGNIIRDEDGGFKDDAIVKLSSDGKLLYEKSLSQILIDNGIEYILFTIGDINKFTTDPIHLNDIQPVDFNTEFWKKGDVFLSLRHQSMVLLYRPSTNKIIWRGTGLFFHQHDVDILDDHRISIFNNNSKTFINGDKVDGHNEVIIYDFKSNQYYSYLKDSLVQNDVRTNTAGRSEILPGGDLIIEETNFGRTLYFNSDGSLRWTHLNRADNGNVYKVAWSRIMHTQKDIETVKYFLDNKGSCNG